MGDAPHRVRILRATLALALHAAFSLALAAHIVWRRLRWVPVEGEPIVASREAGPPIPQTSVGAAAAAGAGRMAG